MVITMNDTDLGIRVDLDALYDFLKITSNFQDDVVMNLSPDAIKVNAVDSAHVYMVSHKLKLSRSKKIEHIKFAMPISGIVTLLKVIKKFDDPFDPLTKMKYVELEKIHKNKLYVKINGVTRLVGIDEPTTAVNPKIPTLDKNSLKGHLKIDSTYLEMVLNAFSNESDLVKFEIREPDIKNDWDARIYIIGDERYLVCKLKDGIGIHPFKECHIEFDGSGSVASVYGIDYLLDIIKSFPHTQELLIHIGDDYPIKIEYKFAYTHDEIEGVVMVAPRLIEEG